MRPSTAAPLEQQVAKMVTILRGNVDMLDNVYCKQIDVPDTGLADTEFTVSHGLGRVPTLYLWNIDKSGVVYDSSRVTWTASTMTLKCSVANSALTLLIF